MVENVDELPLPLSTEDAAKLERAFDGIDTTVLREWNDSAQSNGLTEYIVKRIEQRMWKVMKNTFNVGSDGQGLGAEARGIMHAQTEAYINGLMYYKGVLDSVRREYGRRVRQKVGFSPDASPRKSGVKSSREALRNIRDVFGTDFPVR